MNEQEQLEAEVILQDEEGNEVTFDIIDVFDFNGKNYAVLCPKDEDDEESAIIFEMTELDGDELTLQEIEDDLVWEEVVTYWEALIEE